MKQIAIAGVALVLLIGASVTYFLSVNPTQNNSMSPHNQETHWICLAENEPHDFVLTVREIAQFPDGVTCPDCGSNDVMRAYPCQECGRHYPIGRYNASPSNCMHCGAELEGGDISVFHGSEGH
ncbi:MAG: hypothetical protein ACIARQ_11880 [Phycisphaerales bacterium JB061]